MNGASLESTLGLPLKQTRLQGSWVKTTVFSSTKSRKKKKKKHWEDQQSPCVVASLQVRISWKVGLEFCWFSRRFFGGRVYKRSGISVYLTLPIEQATRINVKLLGCHATVFKSEGGLDDFKIPNLVTFLTYCGIHYLEGWAPRTDGYVVRMGPHVSKTLLRGLTIVMVIDHLLIGIGGGLIYYEGGPADLEFCP